jgi:hypothetical protein
MSRYRVVYARRHRTRDVDRSPASCSARRLVRVAGWLCSPGMKLPFGVFSMTIYPSGDDMKEIEPTPWFELAAHSPARDGWYEVQLTSGDTAFAKFGEGEWTDKPDDAFTHWRGLSADPSQAADGKAQADAEATGAAAAPAAEAKGADEPIDAEATAANGVRAAWNAFFPGLGEEQHKPVDAVPNGKAPH